MQELFTIRSRRVLGFSGDSDGKEIQEKVCLLHKIQETQVRSLGQEDPLEEGMATHSSIHAWRIP